MFFNSKIPTLDGYENTLKNESHKSPKKAFPIKKGYLTKKKKGGWIFIPISITGIDRILGTIPTGVSVLILHTSECSWDANALLGITSVKTLERGGTVVFIANDFPSETYPWRYAAETSRKAIEENRLFYIDLFSATGSDTENKDPNVIITSESTNLSYILYHFHEVNNERLKRTNHSGKPVLWCYDNLSTTFFLVGHEEECLRFVWNVRRLIKKFGDIFLATMNIGMHDSKVIATAKNIFDVVIELESLENRGETVRYLRVTKNAGRPFRLERYQYTFDPFDRTFTIVNRYPREP